MDCSPQVFSEHGILQARTLEWVPTPSSRGSSQPRNQTCISCIAGRFLTTEPPGKPKQSLPDTELSVIILASTAPWTKEKWLFSNKKKAVPHPPALSLCRLQEAMSSVTSPFSPMALRKGSTNTQHRFPVPAKTMFLIIYSNERFCGFHYHSKSKRPWCWERLKIKGDGDDSGWNAWMDMNLSRLWEMVKDRGTQRAAVHGVAKSWMWLSDYKSTVKLIIVGLFFLFCGREEENFSIPWCTLKNQLELVWKYIH